MNLEALEYIVNNRVDLIEDNVTGTRYDPLATVGVAKLLLAKKGDLNVLSVAQSYHYEKFIRPLIEQVSCEGVVGDGTCTGNGFVDDESLIGGYIEGELLCQHCRFDLESMSTK